MHPIHDQTSTVLSVTRRRFDQRESVRISSHCGVTWSSSRGGGAGEVVDLAPRGAFLRAVGSASQALDVGSRVRLGIRMPGSRNFTHVWAIVRREGTSFSHGCYGFGVEFEVPQYRLFNQFWRPSTNSPKPRSTFSDRRQPRGHGRRRRDLLSTATQCSPVR